MDLVVKISTDYITHTAQFINPEDIIYSEELVNNGTMSFKVNIFDPQISELFEFRKVELYSIENGADSLLWTGYIEDLNNDEDFVFVKCQDEKDFLKTKQLFSDKGWGATSISDALSVMVTEANIRKGANEGDLSFTTALTNNVDKDFKAGDSYFSILKELAGLFDVQWRVEKNEIIFETTVGTDRTISGADFFEFVWNVNSPNENNVTSFFNKRGGAQIATRVLGKDKSGSTSEKFGDTDLFGSVERFKSFNDGSLATQTQEYVDKRDSSQLEREFDVRVTEAQFVALSIGDLVKVRMIHGSPLVDTNTSLKIINKKSSFKNKKPTLSIKVSAESKEIVSMVNFLSDLTNRTRSLELN